MCRQSKRAHVTYIQISWLVLLALTKESAPSESAVGLIAVIDRRLLIARCSDRIARCTTISDDDKDRESRFYPHRNNTNGRRSSYDHVNLRLLFVPL